MSWTEKIRELFGAKATPEKTGDTYARVTARVSTDEEAGYSRQVDSFIRGINTIAAKFPFEFYEVIDNLTMIDPYVAKYHQTTISLGNHGHNLEIDAPNEARANEAIQVANDLAARCFPLSGGMDGLVNALLSQVARTGGNCVEWVPSFDLSRVDAAYIVPIKSLRWRYATDGSLELVQQQGQDYKPLNMAQTTYHNATMRDTNPYPIPPAIAALESCFAHRTIIEKIRTWMEKVSALGVLLAEVTPPPREPGEAQAAYDSKAQIYLDKIADSLTENMASGIGVGYNNIKFQFQNTHASAQGAQDILQIVLQGLFAGLQRDPIFFGWNWNTTEAFARVVYEEMLQGIKAFRLGIKRVLEHGHRLNLALAGMADIGISVQFRDGRSIDAFRDAEADYMVAQSVIAQMEAGIVSDKEARKILGHDDKKAQSGNFIASFSQEQKCYRLIRPEGRRIWQVDGKSTDSVEQDESDYEGDLMKTLKDANNNGKKALLAWILMELMGRESLPSEAEFVREATAKFIQAVESTPGMSEKISTAAQSALTSAWSHGQTDPRLFPPGTAPEHPVRSAISAKERAAIAYLSGRVEPWLIETYLSRSANRQSQLTTAMTDIYKLIEATTDTAQVSIALTEIANRLTRNTSQLVSSVAVRRAKSWGQLHQLEKEGVEWFMVDGPRDGRKCAFCWAMLGRRFSVAAELGKIRRTVDSENPDVHEEMVFLKSRFKGDSGFAELSATSDSDLQQMGAAAPPYHGECRDYLVAVR